MTSSNIDPLAAPPQMTMLMCPCGSTLLHDLSDWATVHFQCPKCHADIWDIRTLVIIELPNRTATP